ncbi:MAG: hypothetical protein ACI9HB_002351 [Gammaproteobacteria bacterium]|jgi:hypothetical protein
MNSPTFVAITGLTFLTACGGSSSGPLSFSEALGEVQSIYYEAESWEQTPRDDLKVTGSAECAGFFMVTEEGVVGDVRYDGVDYDSHSTDGGNYIAFHAIGEATVAVDFEEETISGSASNFYEVDLDTVDLYAADELYDDAEGTAIAGSFDIIDGGYGVEGTLTHVNGTVVIYGADLDYADFFGADSEVFVYEADGISSVGGDVRHSAYILFAGHDTSASD